MKTYHLVISTPDGNAFDGEAEMLTLRGSEGDLAVLAGHAPFITAVVPCKCTVVLPDDTERTADIGGGLLTVDTAKTTLLCSEVKFEPD